MQTTLIDQGVSLMLYGMGTVFVFLTILVIVTGLMSKFVNQFQADTNDATDQTTADAGQEHKQPSPQIRHAIIKAIAAHRQR